MSDAVRSAATTTGSTSSTCRRPERSSHALRRRFGGRYPIDRSVSTRSSPISRAPVVSRARARRRHRRGARTARRWRGARRRTAASASSSRRRSASRSQHATGAGCASSARRRAPFVGGVVPAPRCDLRQRARPRDLRCAPAISSRSRSRPRGCAPAPGTPPLPLMQAMTRAPSIPVAVTPGGPLGTMLRPWRVRFGPVVTLDQPHEPGDPLGAARLAEAVRDARRPSSCVRSLTSRAATDANGGWRRAGRSGPRTASRSRTTRGAGATARPCLLIQGLGMDSRGWALQRGSFGRRHRCVAPDNRGTGVRATRRRARTTCCAWPRTRSRCSTPKASRRAHVVGASMGGVIAQIIGVLHRERVAVADARLHRVPPPRLAPRAARGVGRRSSASAACARWPTTTACAGSIGPRLQRRFGVWINVLARVLMQTKPEPFVAQVRRDPRRERRTARRAATRSPSRRS